MNKTKKLIIVGAGETAALAYEHFTYDSAYEVCAFAVEKAFLTEKEFYGLPIVAFENVRQIYPPEKYEAFVAVSSSHLNRDRTRLYNQAKAMGYVCASYVSSEASVWHNCTIGENCFIMPKTTVQPFAKIGNNVILWSGSNVGHRSIVEDNCFFATAGVAGFSKIGKNCFLGAYSSVGDQISVAEDNYLAMGAVVVKSTRPNSVYRGNPAARNKLVEAKFLCQVKE